VFVIEETAPVAEESVFVVEEAAPAAEENALIEEIISEEKTVITEPIQKAEFKLSEEKIMQIFKNDFPKAPYEFSYNPDPFKIRYVWQTTPMMLYKRILKLWNNDIDIILNTSAVLTMSICDPYKTLKYKRNIQLRNNWKATPAELYNWIVGYYKKNMEKK